MKSSAVPWARRLALFCMIAAAWGEVSLGYKFAAFGRGLVQMLLSTEGSKVDCRHLMREPDAALLEGWVTEARTVVFVRHGESTWNEIFNRDTGLQRLLWMPLRVVRGLVREASALLSSESTFLDSPLSGQGIQQAVSLREALVAGSVGVEPRERPPVLLFQALKEQDDTTSVIVASNLLRAIETITIALADRLVVTGEQIYVRSELQEISRNFDAISLLPPLMLPHTPRTSVVAAHAGAALDYRSLYCTDGNRGNKDILIHPKHRLERFASFCFGDSAVDGLPLLRSPGARVIVAGHSLWFRAFFRMYLDKNTSHSAKEGKLSNSGVVAFTLERGVYVCAGLCASACVCPRAIYASGGNKQTRMNRRSYPHIYTRSQEWLGDRCCIEFPQTRFSSFMAVLRLARATMHRRLTSTSDVLVS